MSKIFKTSAGILNNMFYDSMEQDVLSYWGKSIEEKIFPIPLWKLKQLFNAFQSTEVALRVTDITSTTFVDAQWVAFNEDLEAVLQDPVKPNDYYFVLSEVNFASLRDRAAQAAPINQTIITARLGKTTKDVVIGGVTIQEDVYLVFFAIGKNDYIKPGGGGGEGTSTGFKVPAT